MSIARSSRPLRSITIGTSGMCDAPFSKRKRLPAIGDQEIRRSSDREHLREYSDSRTSGLIFKKRAPPRGPFLSR